MIARTTCHLERSPRFGREDPVCRVARFGERPEHLDGWSLALCRRCDREVWVYREHGRRPRVVCEPCAVAALRRERAR